jgi:hypothetical protein
VRISDGTVGENYPDEEQLESYVLHLRKFLQRNDRVCIYKVNEYIQKNFSSRKEIIEKWDEIFNEFNSFFNSQSLIGRVCIPGNEHDPLSLREIFQVRTYGDLSHLDRAKRKVHSELSANRTIEAFYRMGYIDFLFKAGELISEMAKLCDDLLSETT